MASPSANAPKVGPGWLYFAPLGTAEPATPTATPDVAWVSLGYTEKGSTWGTDLTVVKLGVEELNDPIRTITTGRLTHIDAILAECSPANLQRALNGGTVTTTGGFTKYEPPAVGSDVRGMVMWRSNAAPCDEQIILRQVLQTGNLAASRSKGALVGFSCKFDAEAPATGLPAFARWTLDSAFA